VSRNRFDSPQQLVGDEGQRLLLEYFPRCRIEAVQEQQLHSFMCCVPTHCATHSHPRFVADVRGLHRATMVMVLRLALPLAG